MAKHSNKSESHGAASTIVAILANSAVAAAKLVGAAFTGSSVMFSEGVHSVADVLNQGLLLIGLKVSSKPADNKFNGGYQQAKYVFNLFSAAGILFIGFGITAYHGIEGLLEFFHGHAEFHFSMINVWILLFSLVMEGISIGVAVKEIRNLAGDNPVRQYIKESGDPTVMAILYEDGAALLGILIALGAILLSKVTGNAIWDPLGSVFVSLMLGYIAIALMRLNAGYLMDKAIPSRKRLKIEEVLERSPYVEVLLNLKTAVISSTSYRIVASIRLNPEVLPGFEDRNLSATDTARLLTCSSALVVDKLEKQIRETVPEASDIVIEFQWETGQDHCVAECAVRNLCPAQPLKTAS